MVVSLSSGIVAPGEGIEVILKSSKYTRSQQIQTISLFRDEAIVKFHGVDSIAEALRIVGYSLYADLAERKEKRPADVCGFSVFDCQGNCWGKVKAQVHYSLNQLLEIEDAHTGEVIYVPWHDSIVIRIDRRARSIFIDPPPGLKDLNR